MVILIHGIGGSYATWRDLVPRVSPFSNVISVSLRGWGDSRDNSKAAPSIATYAHDITLLMNNLKIKKACLVGYELGAIVALELAGVDDRIQSVSVIDASIKAYHPLGVDSVKAEFDKWKTSPNEEFLSSFLGRDYLVRQKTISRGNICNLN